MAQTAAERIRKSRACQRARHEYAEYKRIEKDKMRAFRARKNKNKKPQQQVQQIQQIYNKFCLCIVQQIQLPTQQPQLIKLSTKNKN